MEQQQLAAERDRQHQATYREKNREDLRIWEADRRAAYAPHSALTNNCLTAPSVYEATYGPEAYTLYLKARRDRRRRARDKRRAKEGYFPQAIPSGVAPERRGDVDDGRRSAH
ncbi:hypothetical protein B0H15DRAFT_945773 [Mycena belliarum]|uniref:Uncharacterized protein n=1 Tax=Mycena belliarum TaxID=1033014 RepID=A0AAD6UCB4_9AGAR|nr:hypothetical protein B0H15DRAFT_945773 [Mycena belliae]